MFNLHLILLEIRKASLGTQRSRILYFYTEISSRSDCWRPYVIESLCSGSIAGAHERAAILEFLVVESWFRKMRPPQRVRFGADVRPG